MHKVKPAQKVAWRIVSDPFAPEKLWLPACNELAGSALLKGSAPAATVSATMLALANAACLFAAFAACSSIESAFDWGYFTVEDLVGQLRSAQGTVAAVILILVVPPWAYGACCGQISAFFTKQKWLRLCPLAACVFYALWLASKEAMSVDPTSVAVLGAAFSVAVFFSYLAYLCALKAWQFLRSISSSAIAVFAPLFVAALIGLYGLLPNVPQLDQLHGQSLPQLAVWAALLWLPSFAGALASKTSKTITAVAFAWAACLPVMLAAMLNVIGTVVSLGLDQAGLGAELGWRACFSAALIAAVGSTVVAAAGYLAAIVNKTLRRSCQRVEN